MNKKWTYFGLFISKNTRDYLLKFLKNYEGTRSAMQIANKIYLDHCTLMHVSQLHGNLDIYEFLKDNLNKKVNLTLTEIGISRNAMAFKVTGKDLICVNNIPHITIATFDNGKPVDSNNIKSWFTLEKPIEIVGTLKQV